MIHFHLYISLSSIQGRYYLNIFYKRLRYWSSPLQHKNRQIAQTPHRKKCKCCYLGILCSYYHKASIRSNLGSHKSRPYKVHTRQNHSILHSCLNTLRRYLPVRNSPLCMSPPKLLCRTTLHLHMTGSLHLHPYKDLSGRCCMIVHLNRHRIQKGTTGIRCWSWESIPQCRRRRSWYQNRWGNWLRRACIG